MPWGATNVWNLNGWRNGENYQRWIWPNEWGDSTSGDEEEPTHGEIGRAGCVNGGFKRIGG